jgi:hypothetical protein
MSWRKHENDLLAVRRYAVHPAERSGLTLDLGAPNGVSFTSQALQTGCPSQLKFSGCRLVSRVLTWRFVVCSHPRVQGESLDFARR